MDSGYCLPPTVCYHVYDMVSGTQFSDGQAYTALGKSFRYENKYHDPTSRLWDFTIRETVFIGPAAYVQANVEAYRAAACALMDELHLTGQCVSATDPFFISNEMTALTNAQRLTGAKYELRLDAAAGQISIGSFNLHGQFIARGFELKGDTTNGYTFSGCIGIGIERLLFALLAQHGLDPARWPSALNLELARTRDNEPASISGDPI